MRFDEFRNLVRFKTRLVAKGCSQKYSEDFKDTCTLVARILGFRFLLFFANRFILLIHYMNVIIALL